MALLSFWITSLVAWAGDRATKSRCPDSDRFSHYIVMGCGGCITFMNYSKHGKLNVMNVNGMHCSSQNQGVLTSIFQVWKMSTMDRDDKAQPKVKQQYLCSCSEILWLCVCMERACGCVCQAQKEINKQSWFQRKISQTSMFQDLFFMTG